MGIIRKTESVELVLNEFEQDANAISATELVKRLGSKMNKTTIYRVLDRLEDDGIVHSFLGNEGIKCYAQCKDCSKTEHADLHPHFECTDCGKIDCLSIEIQIPNIPNRKVSSSQILIQGTCELCS